MKQFKSLSLFVLLLLIASVSSFAAAPTYVCKNGQVATADGVTWYQGVGTSPCVWNAYIFPERPTNASSANLVTSVGSPGSDSNVATEKAVRDAVDAVSTGSALADPGSNGLLFRSALNVTRLAVIGDIPTGYPYANLSGAPGGTVTSVGLSIPSSLCSTSGSPVTTTGTLTCAFATGQTANQVFGTSAAGAVGFGAITKAQQFSTTTYTDQANTFTGVNTFSQAGGTATPSINLTGSGAAGSVMRVGSLEVQPFAAVNNAWIGDNVYYNGTNFVYRAAASSFADMLYFLGNEMQFRIAAAGTAGGTVPLVTSFKVNQSTAAGLGGGISSSTGTFTGAALYTDGTNVAIGRTSSLPSLFSVGSSSQFQVSSAGSVTQALGAKNTCTHGTNGTCGIITLTAGAATISTTAIATLAASGGAGDTVHLECANNPTTTTTTSCASQPFVSAITAGTSFTIGGTATDTVYWEIRHIS